MLPFANMSGDPEQEYFADGMVEEIITALSRIRWLFVIARNSSFTYKGQAVDVKQVGRELGVRYVLEGSVRKAGGRVRITAQLIDATSGAHLWADRFDGSLEDVFELQDKVAISVAGVIEPALQAAETARSAEPPDRRSDRLRPLSARLCDGLVVSEASSRGAASDGAGDRARSALRAGARLGRVLLSSAALLTAGAKIRRRTVARASISRGEPWKWPATIRASWSNAAVALAYFGEDIGAMMALVDRALALNPSFARGWHISGILRMWAGQPDIAIEHVEAALRLSPRARVGTTLIVDRRRAFLQPALRRGGAEAAAWRSRRIRASRTRIAFSPRATRIWGGSTRRERSSRGCAPLPRSVMPRRQLSAERRAPRTVPVGPAPGGGRGDMSQTRRLAAILAADVAGYSRLMGADEEGTLERLKALRRELVDPKIAEHRGRIVKTTGDGLLVEFASVVDAVRCAVEVQQAMPERNTGVAADSRIELRIGINLGDVIVEGDDLYGDGVNIAARIEALADPGGVFVSNTVHDHVRDRLPFVFEDLGEQQVKNIARPVRVYRVATPPLGTRVERRRDRRCRSPTSRRSRCCPSPI